MGSKTVANRAAAVTKASTKATKAALAKAKREGAKNVKKMFISEKEWNRRLGKK
jgi:hypothetical protein